MTTEIISQSVNFFISVGVVIRIFMCIELHAASFQIFFKGIGIGNATQQKTGIQILRDYARETVVIIHRSRLAVGKI
ncbi:hypothetical protein SDC9_72374 [bioreactor metagenome]|uniref:Uncharacterized protein n=1 Tax=bioreactor metagenome TaxID=1076179 RepID=A0A644YIE0_9ZZZZ